MSNFKETLSKVFPELRIIKILLAVIVWLILNSFYQQYEINKMKPPYDEAQAMCESYRAETQKCRDDFMRITSLQNELVDRYKTESDTLRYEKEALIRRLNAQAEINRLGQNP